jgi:hypothetical protein
MSRHDESDSTARIDSGDLRESLINIACMALARSTDPEIVRLHRIAMNESAQFPELAVSGETTRWSPRLRAVMDLLQRHVDAGDIEIDEDEIELAAEHFLALVEALPSRLAEFGVLRSKGQSERHLQYAVKLFLRAFAPAGHKARRSTTADHGAPAGSIFRTRRTSVSRTT